MLQPLSSEDPRFMGQVCMEGQVAERNSAAQLMQKGAENSTGLVLRPVVPGPCAFIFICETQEGV